MTTGGNQPNGSRTRQVNRFFEGNGISYDAAVLLMTLGADRYWKRRILAHIPPSRSILDLACGTGIVTCQLAQRHPGAHVVGVDLTEDFLAVARHKARQLGLDAEFIHANAETVPLPADSFDCVVSSYIPKYVDAGRLLANIGPALRSGGTIVLHDFTLPANWWYRFLWLSYCHMLGPLWMPLFPHWKPVFKELGPLVIRTRWVDDFAAELPARGFVDVQTEYLTFGSTAVLWAKKG